MSSTALATANSSLRTASPAILDEQSTARLQTPQKPLKNAVNQQTPQSTAPARPGTWRHPRLDEIARRQNASTFNSDNINRALFNGALLLSTFVLPETVGKYTPYFVSNTLSPLDEYKIYLLWFLRLVLVLRLVYTLRPLWSAEDCIEDIPLTPSQRALLGLKPSNTPLTPGEQYVTPPRYSRSATPRSSALRRTSSRSPFSGSPIMGRERSISFDRGFGRSARGGSGSPYGGSPLYQKALTESTSRRLSFDGSGSGGLSGTPTPGVGTGHASVGLNNKWLYERGRASLGSRSVFS